MSSDDRVRDLRLQMAQIRAAGRDHVEHIVDSARLTTDWRYYMQQYPWGIVAAAVGVGYLLMPRGTARVDIDQKSAAEFFRREAATSRNSPSTMRWVASLALPFLLRNAVNGAWQLLQASLLERTPESSPVAEESATPRQSFQPR